MAISQPDLSSFELGPIRPPSEAFSLLIRATRNCPWNRCKFCSLYKGTRFELRPVEEIKQDILAVKAIQDGIRETAARMGKLGRVREVAAGILNHPSSQAVFNVALWLYGGGENVFLQDSNTLIMPTPELVEVLNFLKETLPTVKRVTSYARSHTVNKKTLEELAALHQAGLSRLHLGLETGYDPLLEYMEKGVTAAEHISAGKKVVASGISLSEYVILGLGGKTWWREHATATAEVLNQVTPDFIRVRTLVVKEGMPLYDEVASGRFRRANDEEIVAEEKLFLSLLTCPSRYFSDHITNLLQELEGPLPEDKEKMLAIIERFQALPPEERANFIVGRRMGVYNKLADLENGSRRHIVEEALPEFLKDDKLDQDKVYSLMERFI